MPDNALITYSKAFAVEIIRACETMRSRGKSAAIINQLFTQRYKHRCEYSRSKLCVRTG